MLPTCRFDSGGTPVSMPVLEENEFRLNAGVVMSHVTDGSRIMTVNSLRNPTGAVFLMTTWRPWQSLRLNVI